MLTPFQIQVPSAALDDLRERLARTRWLTDHADTWEDGANPTCMRDLVAHWRTGFDWRAQE